MQSSNENTSHPADGGCTLVVMAKAPRRGEVKTRLANAIPIEAVTELYRCLLDDTVALARSLGDVQVAIMCPAADAEELTRSVRGAVVVVAQTGDGLAAGLISVFAHFTARGRKRVVAFNSDSPHLPASILRSAFETLESRDVVVGPTHDGGYYLVGARASHPSLFDGDGMGTRSALEALLVRALESQLSVGFTEPFYDIDVEADLVRLAEELRLAPDRAPRTAAWLSAWEQVAAQSRTSAAEL